MDYEQFREQLAEEVQKNLYEKTTVCCRVHSTI